MVNATARLIAFGGIWLAAVWLGGVALVKPRRILDFVQEQMPTLNLWDSIFMKEESQRLWSIRFQGAILLALLFAFAADYAPRYFRSWASLTFSSTRTPPALPSVLSHPPSSSAPLIVSVQAWPVSFDR